MVEEGVGGRGEEYEQVEAVEKEKKGILRRRVVDGEGGRG